MEQKSIGILKIVPHDNFPDVVKNSKRETSEYSLAPRVGLCGSFVPRMA